LEKLYQLRASCGDTAKWHSAVMWSTAEQSGELTLRERCLRQVADMASFLRSEFASIPPGRRAHVRLEDFRHDPRAMVHGILERFAIPVDAGTLEVLA
jgi:hypothetical protein